MSLLTSPQTTREQQRFFNLMEKQFKKRTFSNSNYMEPPHPFQNANQQVDKATELLKELMDSFLGEMKRIFEDANDNRVDYYFMLSMMKGRDFFNEVSSIITDDIIQRLHKIERQNIRLKESLKRTQIQLRELQKVKKAGEKNHVSSSFNGIKSVAENLYEKAKILSQQQFVQLCNRVILQEKVVIKKMAETGMYRKWDEQKEDKKEEKQMLSKVNAFIQKNANQRQSDLEFQLVQLIIDFKRYNEQRQAALICQRPCCNTVQEKIVVKSKASVLRRSTDSRRQSVVYKSDKAQEYFNRYYRKSEFDMHQILNVERTKLEEMQKIEDNYRIISKQRHKISRSMVK